MAEVPKQGTGAGKESASPMQTNAVAVSIDKSASGKAGVFGFISRALTDLSVVGVQLSERIKDPERLGEHLAAFTRLQEVKATFSKSITPDTTTNPATRAQASLPPAPASKERGK